MKYRKLTNAPTWEQVCAELFCKRNKVTAERLRDLLRYDPETGEFTWLVGRTGRANAGGRAGCQRVDGYGEIKIDGVGYLSHRLAFLYMLGRWPTDEVDHINQIKGDNRWCNLREATTQQNIWNTPTRTKLSDLPRGVKATPYGKYTASIGRDTYLGIYETPEKASAVYEEAARMFYGEFYCPPNPAGVAAA